MLLFEKGYIDFMKPLSTPHFRFFCEEAADAPEAAALGDALEREYARITADLGVKIRAKTEIRLYHSLSGFHRAIGFPDAPDWVMGNASGCVIGMVRPGASGIPHTPEAFKKIIVHEFVHVAVYRLNPFTSAIPAFLNEGTAVCEAGQMERADLAVLRDRETYPRFEELLNSMTYDKNDGYLFSYSIVRFILDRYGKAALTGWIRHPAEPETALGCPLAAFRADWEKELRG